MKTPTAESDIQSLILIYLTSLPSSFFWRQNTGQAKIGNRWVKFGIKGAADIQGALQGRAVAVEVKRSRGGKQSDDQKNWQRNFERGGGLYILARSVSEVEERLREKGLIL